MNTVYSAVMGSLEIWKNRFEDYFRHRNPITDGSHDVHHLRRVWNVAEKMAVEGEDKLVILAACYFHDLVNYPKDSPKRSMSSRDSAEKAVEILQKLRFPTARTENVRHCIVAHSFSANITPKTAEAKIVQDADRLEALGAIGLARTFYVSGQMQSQLFCAEDPFAENRPLNDKSYALDHFYTKLLKIPQQMNTERGRTLAIERAEFVMNFIKTLEQELAVDV